MLTPSVQWNYRDEFVITVHDTGSYGLSVHQCPAYTLEQAQGQIFQQAGMISVTMVAGPILNQGGNVVVYSFTHGVMSLGQTFINHSTDFKGDFEDKFRVFAKMVLSPAEHVKQSLPGSEAARNYVAPSPLTQTINVAPNSATLKQALIASSSTEVEDKADESMSESESDIEVDLDVVVITPPRENSHHMSDYEPKYHWNAELLKSLSLDKPVFAPRTKNKCAPRKPKELGQLSTQRSSRLADSSKGGSAKTNNANNNEAALNAIEAEGVANAADASAEIANGEVDTDANAEVAIASEADGNTEGNKGADNNTKGNKGANGGTEGGDSTERDETQRETTHRGRQ
ncbi:hypothetical protein IMY05_C4464000100 [Salix suchowensis]|nr:hypothetical protein IMY05_C4464000100 [Salix suchowensis]